MMEGLAWIVLCVAVAAHLFSSLMYVRLALADAPKIERLVFVVRELAIFATVAGGIEQAPWVAVAFATYVLTSVYTRAATLRHRSSNSTAGIARLLAR